MGKPIVTSRTNILNRLLAFGMLGSVLVYVFTSGCGRKGAQVVRPGGAQGAVQADTKTPMVEPANWRSVSEVNSACDESLGAIEKLRGSIVARAGKGTLEDTLRSVNEMYTEMDTLWSMLYLYMSVHPNKEVRSAAETCDQRISKVASDISLDRGIFDAIESVDPDSLDPMAARFRAHLIRDYRLAGVDKDEKTRAKIAGLNNEITTMRQAFSRAITEDPPFMEVPAKKLTGLPDDFMKSHPPGENGKVRLGTDRPTVNAVLAYADDEGVRKQMTKIYLSRGYPANKENLEKLLELRYELSNLLGFEDWASYNAKGKMAGDRDTITRFLDEVAAISKPAMERELAALLKAKKKNDKGAKTVYEWDRSYYRNKVMAESYELDPQELRQYFEYRRVRDGILEINETLFGLEFKKNPSASVWHEDVEAYDVFESGALIGRFYLDMHPREGKYDHAMEQPMIPGVRGVQLPVASLICNFPRPNEAGPALMEHGDVSLFMHEFGHLMHQLLAGDNNWVTLSGINCEADFAEAPAQLLEEWVYEPEALERFAVHHETGEAIPVALAEKLRAASEADKGLYVMRQLFYAAVSLNLHVGDPDRFELVDVVKDAKRTFSPYPFEKGTFVYASFTHLEGYTSMCYSYIWTLVMAKDLFSRFAAAPSVMDTNVAMEYRRAILDPGGNIDAAKMMESFLGRKYSLDAFRNWIQK